jgi:hypothetical protein
MQLGTGWLAEPFSRGETLPDLSTSFKGQNQGCQMVYFNTKNPNLGIFWRALEWKMLVYFMTIVNT